MIKTLTRQELLDVIAAAWDNPSYYGFRPPYRDARFMWPAGQWGTRGLFDYWRVSGMGGYTDINDPALVTDIKAYHLPDIVSVAHLTITETINITRWLTLGLRLKGSYNPVDEAEWDTLIWGNKGDLTGKTLNVVRVSVRYSYGPTAGDEHNSSSWTCYFISYTGEPLGGAVTITAKPTWDEIVDAHRKLKLLDTSEADNALAVTPDYRSVLTDASAVTVGPDSIHVGEGLDHMTGLADMARASALAGAHLPHIVMRDGDQNAHSVHLVGRLEDILDATRRRENVVESAHNVVMERYHAQARIRDDETADLDDREAAAAKALEIAKNYKAHLEAEIAAYDPDALPSDLGELKAVYIERLEAAANRRVKWFKGVLTQQGVDLDPSCDDEADAIRKVVIAVRHGTGEVNDAGDKAKAKAAFDAAVARIEAVTPLNVPVVTHAIAGRVVTVTAAHPTGETIPGKVRIEGWSVKGAAVDKVQAKTTLATSDTSAAKLALTFAADVTGSVTITVAARNLCGPVSYKATVTLS